ncbi:hypothetical protein [Spirochaeta africana]|uniref:Uncharacterized protein n=1 Tax=Spirochaeta africana (strain ATCC 700263 / DSM 8902 / Z-7692) TaxID=889378 RepID=H9UG47_SPIAZ|nr:hypothetical protein [Spirochaeta africana]AFG36490.1 hypothetical protein Spiaf_0385 [Spirochaeta africana DSM 8902]
MLSGSDKIDDYLLACDRGFIGSWKVRREDLQRICDEVLAELERLRAAGKERGAATAAACAAVSAAERGRRQRRERLWGWFGNTLYLVLLFGLVDVAVRPTLPWEDAVSLAWSVGLAVVGGYSAALASPGAYRMRREWKGERYRVGAAGRWRGELRLGGVVGLLGLAGVSLVSYLQVIGPLPGRMDIWLPLSVVAGISLLGDGRNILVTPDELAVQHWLRRFRIPRSRVDMVQLCRRRGPGRLFPGSCLKIRWRDELGRRRTIRFPVGPDTENTERLVAEFCTGSLSALRSMV